MLNPESLMSFLSEAAQTEFTRTCAIFGFAAFVHASQVRREIKQQFGELVSVLKKDLEGQRFLLGNLTDRLVKVENKLGIPVQTQNQENKEITP